MVFLYLKIVTEAVFVDDTWQIAGTKKPIKMKEINEIPNK